MTTSSMRKWNLIPIEMQLLTYLERWWRRVPKRSSRKRRRWMRVLRSRRWKELTIRKRFSWGQQRKKRKVLVSRGLNFEIVIFKWLKWVNIASKSVKRYQYPNTWVIRRWRMICFNNTVSKITILAPIEGDFNSIRWQPMFTKSRK